MALEMAKTLCQVNLKWPQYSFKLLCFVDFDMENHLRYRMTLSLGIDGEGMLGFGAVHQTGTVQDLGVAFVNLPSTCWAAASCSSAGDVTAVKVYYHSGPEGNHIV